MLVGTCYLIQGLTLLYIGKNKNNSKHIKTIGRTLITISIIHYICSIIFFITKLIIVKSIASLSIILGFIVLLKISKELKKEMEHKMLVQDSIEIMKKLSE